MASAVHPDAQRRALGAAARNASIMKPYKDAASELSDLLLAHLSEAEKAKAKKLLKKAGHMLTSHLIQRLAS